MKRLYFAIQLVFLLSTTLMYSQTPTVEWKKTIGGTLDENLYEIIQTSDGGFVFVGQSTSNDFDIVGNYGNADVSVIKLNASGNIVWQKHFGGTLTDESFSVLQTTDLGYIIAGSTQSNDLDISLNHGSFDAWVLKIDALGSLQWEKTYGGTQSDGFQSIEATNDNGFIAVGHSYSSNGNVTNNYGSMDAWVVKINNLGNIVWQKNFGGSDVDYFYDIKKTNDNKYILVGETNSTDVDITNVYGSYDAWIIKIDNLGNVEWKNSFGGSNYDSFKSIDITTDNSIIVSGYSHSTDGIAITNNSNIGSWIMKFSASGAVNWCKFIGGTNEEASNSVCVTNTDEILVGNFTLSNNGNVSVNYGTHDFWLVKLDILGNIIWEKSYGGTNQDVLYSILESSDNDYVIAGTSLSNDVDLVQNYGSTDFWILKLNNENLSSESFINSNNYIFPIPSKNDISLRSDDTIEQITIYDLSGKLVFEEKNINSKSKTINISNLITGNYIVKMKTNVGVNFVKFIKN